MTNSFDEGRNPYHLDSAIAFATNAHATRTPDGQQQMYGDGVPYTKHLEDVDNVICEFIGYGPFMRTCGWLHDTIEDTNVTFDELVALFGLEIADIVSRVSNKPGVNRAARHAATYPGIRESLKATMIKLADRIANVRSGGKSGMYLKEYPSFRAALHQDYPLGEMYTLAEGAKYYTPTIQHDYEKVRRMWKWLDGWYRSHNPLTTAE